MTERRDRAAIAARSYGVTGRPVQWCADTGRYQADIRAGLAGYFRKRWKNAIVGSYDAEEARALLSIYRVSINPPALR